MGWGQRTVGVLAGLTPLSLLLAISQVQWGGDWGGDGRDPVGRVLSSCEGPTLSTPKLGERRVGDLTQTWVYFSTFLKKK